MRLNKAYFLTLLFSLLCCSLYAQNAYVTGTVTDSTGTPLIEARIRIVNSQIGTTAGQDGSYRLMVQAGQPITLEFGFLGYNYKKINVPALQPTEVYRLNVVMSSTYILHTVTISGNIKEQKRLMQKINPEAFSAIPNVSGGIESILKTLAGVSSNNELSSQYSVRGGNYDENLVYINDIEIYKPMLVRSGQEEGLSIVNSDLVSNLNFSAGGFEAKYGDKMSSVLDIQYKEPDSFAAKVSASLMGAAVALEGSTKNHRFTYLFGGRYRSNAYLLKSLDVQGSYKPAFTDIQTFLTYYLTENLKISYLGYFGQNRYLSIPETQETIFGTVKSAVRLKVYFDGKDILKYSTLLNGVTADYSINQKNRLKLISSVYLNDEQENFDIIGQYRLQQLESDLGSDDFGDVASTFGIGGYLDHARNRINSLIYNTELKGNHSKGKQLELSWGLKFQHEDIQDKLSEYKYIDSVDYSVPNTHGDPFHKDTLNKLNVFEYIYSTNHQKWNRYMGYVQNTFTIASEYNAFITLGVRGNYWDYNKDFLISPRAQFTFEPNAPFNRDLILKGMPDSLFKRSLRFKFAAGAYHQPPFYRELRNLTGILNPNIRAQRSYHFVAGTDLNFKMWDRPFKWSTEVYYKMLRDIIPYEIDNVRVRYYAENNAKGYATGIDMQLNGELVPDNPSWISLSVMKTQEDINNDDYFEEDKNGNLQKISPGYIPRPMDQRVRFSMFFQDFLPTNPTYKVHLQLVFGSGLPFGPPDYKRYKDVSRLPPYRRVDIGFSKMLFDRTVMKKENWLQNFKSIWLSAEVFNLFQINNTVSYLWVRDINGGSWAVPSYLTGRRLNIHLEIKF